MSAWFRGLFDITGYTYTGNWTQLVAWRYMQAAIEFLLKIFFGVKWWTIVLYLSYFAINYFVSEKIFSIYIDKKYAYIGALVYAFNPLSIYMLNEVWFLYVYSAVPLILYGCHIYFYGLKHRTLGLLACGFGTIFLTSYTRFMLIYILFFIVVFAFYFADIWKVLVKQTWRCIVFGLSLFLINLPFIFSVIYPIFSGQHEYFGGVSNYAEVFKSYWSATYHAIKSQTSSELLVPAEPTGNFGYPLTQSDLFRYFSFLYFSAIIFFLLYKQHDMSEKHTTLFSLGIFAITLGAMFRLLPTYVSENIFIYISYTLLPFLANNSAFTYRLTLGGISLLLPLALYYASRVVRIIISLWALAYCFATASILFFFHDNQKLRTVDIPENHPVYDVINSSSSVGSSSHLQGSLIYPSNYVLFARSPYPVPIDSSVPGISAGVEGNERTTTSKQINFSRYLWQLSILDTHIENLGILTLSSFFVLQDLRDNMTGVQFDYYNASDTVQQAQNADTSLIQNTGVVFVDANALYKKYTINNTDLFSFYLYLPKSLIILSWYDSILDTWIDLANRPLLVDPLAYNKPDYITSGYEIPYFTGQGISIKTWEKIPFSYYIKLSHVTSWQDVLLQFTKTFGVNWKIQYISKDIYESVICTWSTYYPISDNTLCYMDGEIPPLREFFYSLRGKHYADADHFEGNIISNARLLKNVDTADGDVYLRLSNEEQYLFILTELIGVITLLILLLVGLVVFRKNNTPVWKQ